MHVQTRIDDGHIACVHRRSQPEPCPMFQFMRWLGGGRFGDIHLGRRLKDAKEIVLKLKIEHVIYSILHNRKNKKLDHFPFFHRFEHSVNLNYTEYRDGKSLDSGMDKFNFLAIERLGPDCSKLLDHAKQQELYKKNSHPNQEFNRGLSYTTVVEVGEQLFSALKYMHEKEIIHRDIKPQNILAGRGKDRIRNIFLVDFGVAKRFKEEGKFMKDGIGTRVGSAHYHSINLMYDDASVRDDCISAIYVLVELYKSKLWWEHLHPNNEDEEMCEMKTEYLDEDKWADEFPELVPLCKVLVELHITLFDEMPPYALIKTTFDEMKTSKFYKDQQLDWLIEENGFKKLW
ncbi:Oidioi.mRNA.OKI2018_I69.PAR.g11316.t1.cds [Oikopleura dioica]|uniref:Oidioi.mRNA.OKI2018_I69.PAR.g11316.t1.cds n=1 Tax=Oikopleura dioica TaxID=34765 RepID=A0ABN7RVF0_OIKDI|nr:Oidioi.mRNA.OKI2018_I69.PAR.g11316.t1.cds [Oikopleura dioica]